MPGLGRSPGGGWQPVLVFLLENPTDSGAWQATVQKGCKESDMTEWLNTEAHTHTHIHTHTHMYTFLSPGNLPNPGTKPRSPALQMDSLPAKSSEKANVHIRTYIITIGMCVLATQSCPALCNLMNCNPPGSSVHGILQERILEWVAMYLLQGVFLTQELKPSLPHWRQILYCLSRQESPIIYIYVYILHVNILYHYNIIIYNLIIQR